MKQKTPSSGTKATPAAKSKKPQGPFTLAIDIGGTGLKAAVLDANGEMITERARVQTPHPTPPGLIVQTLTTPVPPLPAYDPVSFGFPCLVLPSRILTLPNLGPATR